MMRITMTRLEALALDWLNQIINHTYRPTNREMFDRDPHIPLADPNISRLVFAICVKIQDDEV